MWPQSAALSVEEHAVVRMPTQPGAGVHQCHAVFKSQPGLRIDLQRSPVSRERHVLVSRVTIVER